MSTSNEILGIATPVPMGEWQSNVPYRKLNIVRSHSATYIAKKDNISVEPTITQGWQEVWQVVVYDGKNGNSNVSEDRTLYWLTVEEDKNIGGHYSDISVTDLSPKVDEVEVYNGSTCITNFGKLCSINKSNDCEISADIIGDLKTDSIFNSDSQLINNIIPATSNKYNVGGRTRPIHAFYGTEYKYVVNYGTEWVAIEPISVDYNDSYTYINIRPNNDNLGVRIYSGNEETTKEYDQVIVGDIQDNNTKITVARTYISFKENAKPPVGLRQVPYKILSINMSTAYARKFNGLETNYTVEFTASFLAGIYADGATTLTDIYNNATNNSYCLFGKVGISSPNTPEVTYDVISIKQYVSLNVKYIDVRYFDNWTIRHIYIPIDNTQTLNITVNTANLV